jgi:16S rRNA (guanine(966)-N(2))-methyltransferase RsmD
MLHILTGRYKGRKLLPPPPGAATRPITAAARKSLFDTLTAWTEGALVLDLFCGTGTVGLEALSRGAKYCCFADHDRRVLDRLRRNIQAVGAEDQSRIWAGDIPRQLAAWLRELDRPVDLAFVDPPYADARSWDWSCVVRQVFAPLAERLVAEGVLVLRLPAQVHPPEDLAGLRLTRTRRQGGMTLGFYRHSRKEG